MRDTLIKVIAGVCGGIAAFAVILALSTPNPHYDIVIRPGLIKIHTTEYSIHDDYVCTPTQCIPQKRVKEILIIRNCPCHKK